MLESHGEGAPSGENLEYDPDFIAMELAGQPEEERQAGSEIVEGSDPDYKDLAAKSRVILERSHDIRAAVYLADSELRLNGLTGFAEVTAYIRGCLEEYWDTCHPQLEPRSQQPFHLQGLELNRCQSSTSCRTPALGKNRRTRG